ncbi:hypothetical protein Skr01_51620 [Sphaerisporangium krabiense]|uniref:Uncharacterized protein n=1 Tax=Sphaerisporangium krabiense TaxID=763782 RepID=A0A7W9DSV6_9ACTN|nr:hypothetical protein [Sphaerisporangium krabiense]MBB5630127.1 hypothetical protein [Sphaerisporangium krabiense]GII65077.1 hypothetical protein Skr01_51620 [Sphaerisporangium krabiense]
MRASPSIRRKATLLLMGTTLVGGLLSTAPSASAFAWNCRKVIAQDVRWFASSTGTTTNPPHVLYNGHRFKSFGVANGRYSAQIISPYAAAGWVTADSQYVTQVSDSECNW